MNDRQGQSKNKYRVRNQETTSKNGDSPLKHMPTVNSRHGSNVKSNDEQIADEYKQSFIRIKEALK